MSPHRRNSHEAIAVPLASAAAAVSVSSNPEGATSFDLENGPWPCSAPKNCLFSNGSNLEHIKISKEDLCDAVKTRCSNDQCPYSSFMHSVCFEAFEDAALQHLKASGRAKSWTDKQRVQNLWTKRGYDLVYKACDCLCGHGHLRKDLDWVPPASPQHPGGDPELGDGDPGALGATGAKRKRKKSRSQNGKPTITIGLPMFGAHSHQQGTVHRSDAQNVPRHRTNSISSNASGGSSLSSSGTSPGDQELSSTSPASNDGFQPPRRAQMQDRSRHDSGGSIFLRRLDYSCFNVLPKHKINSYHIKMEDECSIGNDETRIFILSSFASNKMNRVPCVVCNQVLQIFDRYPLIDGTFFLSPRQHNKSCIQVKFESKLHYLSAVCMGCLEGWTTRIHCRYCLKAWSGAHLILGTMYSYDIFAAMPCCAERLKCNNCSQLVIHPEQRFNFFSDYSQMVSCPHCGVQDSHFCKSLALYIRREEAQRIALIQQQQQHQIAAAMGGMRVHRVNSA